VSLIGQFGVGFYSAFLVATKVEVVSKSFKDSLEDQKAWRWISQGSEFTIQPAPEEEFFGEQSGTRLILHLREEAQEYLDTGKLSDLLKKYSEFITFPIELWNEKVQYDQVPDESAPPPKEGEKPKMKSVPRSVYEWEVMNKMKPIWLRNPDVVNQSEYMEFYKTTFKAFDEPLSTTHFKVEGQIEFRALMFIPSTMPFELTRDMFSEGGRAMRLYVKRVFINDKFEDLIPRWLTFVRGVVDSEDLPLNVGREILQKSRTLKIIRKRLVRKVLDSIDDLRENMRDKYDQFWSNYGKYFKVGLVEDLDYKDELKRFVRFYSSQSGDNMTSLPEYVERMKEGQDKIYFVTGEGKKAAEIAPAMERMNKKGYEVLYMIDPLDEICSQSIVDFDGRKLVDINKAGLDLDKTEDEKSKFEQLTKDYEEVAAWLKKQLGERVQKVEIGDRLVDSPATLVQGEWGMSPMMQRYMKSQTTSSSQDSAFAMGSRNQAILEINPEHPVIQKLRTMQQTAPDSEETEDMVMMVYETAALIGGYNIEDPGEFAKRVTKLMVNMGPEEGSAGVVDAEAA
jgi:heat shock protein beta